MYRERGRLLSSYGHPSSHSIVKLAKDVDDTVGTSKPEEDVPQMFSLDSVEGFGEVDKGHKQVLMLFPVLFLKL